MLSDSQSLIAYLNLTRDEPQSLAVLQTLIAQHGGDLSDPWLKFAVAEQALSHLKQNPGGEIQPLLSLLQEVYRALPQYPFVPLKLAELLAYDGQWEAAQKAVDEALALDDQNFLIYFMAGMVFMQDAQPEHAMQVERYLRKSIELNPKFAFAHGFLGMYYNLLGQPEQARQIWLEGLQQLPESAMLPAFLGQLAQRKDEAALA